MGRKAHLVLVVIIFASSNSDFSNNSFKSFNSFNPDFSIEFKNTDSLSNLNWYGGCSLTVRIFGCGPKDKSSTLFFRLFENLRFPRDFLNLWTREQVCSLGSYTAFPLLSTTLPLPSFNNNSEDKSISNADLVHLS